MGRALCSMFLNDEMSPNLITLNLLLGSHFSLILEFASALKLKAVDPQLGNAVSLASTSAVVDEFLRMARYAGEYLGVTEALGATTIGQPYDEGLSMPAKLFFGILGLLALAYLVWDLISRA